MSKRKGPFPESRICKYTVFVNVKPLSPSHLWETNQISRRSPWQRSQTFTPESVSHLTPNIKTLHFRITLPTIAHKHRRTDSPAWQSGTERSWSPYRRRWRSFHPESARNSAVCLLALRATPPAWTPSRLTLLITLLPTPPAHTTTSLYLINRKTAYHRPIFNILLND